MHFLKNCNEYFLYGATAKEGFSDPKKKNTKFIKAPYINDNIITLDN